MIIQVKQRLIVDMVDFRVIIGGYFSEVMSLSIFHSIVKKKKIKNNDNFITSNFVSFNIITCRN